MSARYVIRPKADDDLDEHAFYLAEQAGAAIGHKFLIAAHETFSLIATQPEMGWHPHLTHPAVSSLRLFRISGFQQVLVLYAPVKDGVDIIRVIHGSRDIDALLRREGI
ncbi:MAG TPA: type II toxin-antitoxin system RelE/ParE family toxin [Terriglobia bacterium]|nr:type II toxin-antitoxin system RelE/ParE family toxin [Terriglobia bacterium]